LDIHADFAFLHIPERGSRFRLPDDFEWEMWKAAAGRETLHGSAGWASAREISTTAIITATIG
jgi:hypothetical protein